MLVVDLEGFSMLIALSRTDFNVMDSLLESGTCLVNTEAGLERLEAFEGAENFLAVDRMSGTTVSTLRLMAVKR